MKSLNILMLFLVLGMTGSVAAQNTYRVTAETRNQYTQNYWVDLYIEGNSTTYSKYISAVYYDDGYGRKQVTYSKDYYYANTYQVYINSQIYYFKW